MPQAGRPVGDTHTAVRDISGTYEGWAQRRGCQVDIWVKTESEGVWALRMHSAQHVQRPSGKLRGCPRWGNGAPKFMPTLTSDCDLTWERILVDVLGQVETKPLMAGVLTREMPQGSQRPEQSRRAAAPSCAPATPRSWRDAGTGPSQSQGGGTALWRRLWTPASRRQEWPCALLPQP